MAPGENIAEALQDKQKDIHDLDEKPQPKQISPTETTTYTNANQSWRADQKDSLNQTNTQQSNIPSNDVRTLEREFSLDNVVPVRTATRTLSVKGRESILNREWGRRSVQRQAFIDPILESLVRDEVEAVYEEIRLRQQFERSQIDHSRMIWKGQAEWLASELAQIPLISGFTDEADKAYRLLMVHTRLVPNSSRQVC